MKRLIIFCLFLFHLPDLPAQIGPRFRHYSTSDGLPGNGIPVLTPDPGGFLWVGTVNGLARYDGQNFVPFNRLQQTFKLPEKDVKLAFPDSRGFLWVKFKTGELYRINLSTYAVTVLGDEPPFRAEVDFFPSAAEDRNGDLWFSHPKGLVQYRRRAEKLEFYPLSGQHEKNRVIQLCKDKKGNLWVGAASGLFHFDVSSHKFEHYPLTGGKSFIAAVACDRDGFIWCSKWNAEKEGLVQFDPGQKKTVRAFSHNPGDPLALRSTDIANIYPDGDSVWLAVNAGGLSVLDKKTNRFHTCKPDELDPNSLSSWTVLSVARDPFGNLWAGTDKFLNQIPANDKSTTLFRHNPYNPQSLIYSKTMSVGTVSDALVLMGTEQGFSLYNHIQRTFTNVHLPLYNKNNYNDNIIGMESGDATSCWISTWSGLFHINKQTGRTLEYFITYENAGENHPPAVTRKDLGAIHRLYRDKRGDVWMKRYRGGLCMLPQGSGQNGFLRFDTLVPDGNPLKEQVFCFAEPDERGLLIGTADGVIRYDPGNRRFSRWPADFPGLEKPFEVKGLCPLKNGDLALLVNDKVFRMERGDPTRPAVPVLTPFPLINCIGLVEDDAGSLWVCTETGLAQIRLDNAFSVFYDSRHFLHDNTFDIIWPFQKITKDGAGALYFAGTEGITVVQPAQFRFQKTPPLPKIVSLKINNEYALLDTAIHRKTRLTLSWQQNNLSFEFAALNSPIPALSRFAYRLEGGGQDWLDLGPQNVVHLSNLSPGKYTLGVRVANSDGVWCEQPCFLNITVLPPWYRGTAAWLAYVLLLGAAGYYFYRFQLKRKLEQAENEQLKTLDAMKTRLYTNITHEFRTPLTVILGMTDQIKAHFANQSREAFELGLEMIRRNGRNLLQLINQILDLSKLESGKLSLHLVQDDAAAFTRYLAESFQSYAEAKKIQLQFIPGAGEIVMDHDKEKLQAIVSNLLSNAIKFTPADGQVFVKIERVDDKAVISVRDTGIGIPEDKRRHIFDRFYQVDDSATRPGEGTGIGLALVKELVKLMQGNIEVESAPDAGSTFTVTLPITNNAPPHTPGEMPAAVYTPLPETEPGIVLPVNGVLEKPLLLLVEDNADVRRYIVECLSDRFQVAEARDGQAGIEMAIELVPELVVSDVMMPRKDGFEVCDALKNDERTSHIPIVLLTARAAVEDRIAGLRRGADAYLTKPFHREELLVVLEQLIENRRRLQARYSRGLPDATQEAPDEIAAVEDAFLLKLRGIVEENLGEAEFDMNRLSRAVGMSHSQIFRKLKALTGRSPSTFIRSVRLRHARELLQTTTLTVSEIAYETGFTSPAYFSTVFVEEFGKTPTEVR